MNGLRKGQSLVNKLYKLNPGKDIKQMDLIEFENYIFEHKAELLDHLYNMSDDKFNNLINNI